jgi:NADH dehydrogenase FAD-containing subunit
LLYDFNAKMSTDSITPQKKIVVLGGSYGGTSAAHYILKHVIPHLPEKDTYKVILVSASTQALCRPACPRALISEDMFSQTKLFVDIASQFEQYPAKVFSFISGTTTALDHTNRTVSMALRTGGVEEIHFHALVIATGASTPSPLLGLNRDEEDLRRTWAEFRKALPAAKTIVIAGGGPAGVEIAGELGDYLNGHPGWLSSKSDTPKVNITLVTASKILPALRPSIAQQAETYLSKLGVTIIKNTRIEQVEPQGAGVDAELVTAKTKVTLMNGTMLEADLYIPATGMTPNTSFIDTVLLTADGHVETNTSTLRVDTAGPRIYAVGDVSSYARPAVHNILDAIPVLGSNIKRDLLLASGASESAIGEDRVFKEEKREMQLVPVGKTKGVGAAMGWRLPSWMVWLIKGRDYWLWTTGGLWSGKQWAKES